MSATPGCNVVPVRSLPTNVMQHPANRRLDQDLQTWLDIHPEIQLTPEQRQIALMVWVGAKVFYRPIEPAR